MVDWYRLGQLGSRAMPEYYAAQSRALEAQKQQMGVEQLGEQMARSREIQQRQDITWEQQQADRQAEMQRAEQDRAAKQQKADAWDAYIKRDREKMKATLELDDFEFGDGIVKLKGKNGQSYDVPEEEFVGGLWGPEGVLQAKRLQQTSAKAEEDRKAKEALEKMRIASREKIEEARNRNRLLLEGQRTAKVGNAMKMVNDRAENLYALAEQQGKPISMEEARNQAYREKFTDQTALAEYRGLLALAGKEFSRTRKQAIVDQANELKDTFGFTPKDYTPERDDKPKDKPSATTNQPEPPQGGKQGGRWMEVAGRRIWVAN